MNVVVIGEQNSKLERAIIRALTAYGGVRYINGRTLAAMPEAGKPAHCAYFITPPFEVSLPDAVIVFGRCPANSNVVKIPEQVPCIVSSADTVSLGMLQAAKHTGICCGMATHDTLCIASLEETGQAGVVSVQRELHTMGEHVVEPGDIPVQLTEPCEAYPLLAATAVLLFAGVDVSSGLEF